MGTLSKLLTRANLTAMAVTAALGVASPRLFYAAMTRLFGSVFPVDSAPDFGQLDALMAVVGLAFAALFAVDAARCSAALFRLVRPAQGQFDPTPWGLRSLWFAVLATPAWLPPVEAALGPTARAVAYVVWPLGLLSVLAFVVAGSQVEAATRGETVRLALLTVLFHAGGVVGVGIAKQTFAGSRILKDLPSGMPAATPYLVFGILAFCVLKAVSPIPQVVTGVIGVP